VGVAGERKFNSEFRSSIEGVGLCDRRMLGMLGAPGIKIGTHPLLAAGWPCSRWYPAD